MENIVNSKNKFKNILSQINGEAMKWRKLEKSKFHSKAEHMKRVRREAEEKSLQECPHEMISYKNLIN